MSTRSSTESPALSERRLAPAIAVGLALLTSVVFFETTQYGFTPVDDPECVQANSWVAGGLTPSNVAQSFVETRCINYMPFTQISWMLDSTLFGMDPGGFHLSSVLLHIANVVLLFYVLRAMTAATWPAALVAALFAVHPLHIEPVVWISARKDLVSTFFWFLAMAFYTGYVRRGGAARYLAACMCIAVGMLSKPMLVTLPFALMLCDYWPLNRFDDHRISGRRLWELFREKLPMLAVVTVLMVVAVYAQSQGDAVRSLEQVPIADRFRNTPVAYAMYLLQALVPVGLQAVGYRTPLGLPLWQSAAAFALLVALTGAAVIRMRKAPWLFTGWFWFLGTLVPVIGLVSIGASYRADRYTYVSLIGLFIAGAWSATELFDRLSLPNKQQLAAGAAGLLIVATGALCWWQVGYWADNVILFGRVVERDPGHAQARYALATAHYDRADYREALEHYLIVAERDPNVGGVSFRIGATFYQLGDYARSEFWYLTGLEGRADSPEAWLGLAMAQIKLGKRAEAERSLIRALELRPGYGAALQQLNAVSPGPPR